MKKSDSKKFDKTEKKEVKTEKKPFSKEAPEKRDKSTNHEQSKEHPSLNYNSYKRGN